MTGGHGFAPREHETLLALEEVVRRYLALLDGPEGVADDDEIRAVLLVLDAKRVSS